MEWLTWRVRHWSEWDAIVRTIGSTGPLNEASYIFRGQAVSTWELTPSLVRALKPGVPPRRALKIEEMLESEFRSQAHLHIPPGHFSHKLVPADWWQLMQHHQAPTRLLDWTTSPYVALYFACAERWDEDGAVWYCRPAVTMSSYEVESTRERYGWLQLRWREPDAPNELSLLPARIKNERMVAQQGVFTLNAAILGRHDTPIGEIAALAPGQPPWDTPAMKLVIPAEQKRIHLAALRRMNVSASSLFPGVDGLGRSLSELVKVELSGGDSDGPAALRVPEFADRPE